MRPAVHLAVLLGVVPTLGLAGCGRLGFEAGQADTDAAMDAAAPGPVLPTLPCEAQVTVAAESLGGVGLSATAAGSTAVVVWKNGGETQALAIPSSGAPTQRVLFENVVDLPSVVAQGDDVVVAAVVDTGETLVQRFDGALIAAAPVQRLARPPRVSGPHGVAASSGGGVVVLGFTGAALSLRQLDRDGVPLAAEVPVTTMARNGTLASAGSGYAVAWADVGSDCRQAVAATDLKMGPSASVRSTMLVGCDWAVAYDAQREAHLEREAAGLSVVLNGVKVGGPSQVVNPAAAVRTSSGSGWVMWSDADNLWLLATAASGKPLGPARRLDASSDRYDVFADGDHALAVWRSGSALTLRRLCAP